LWKHNSGSYQAKEEDHEITKEGKDEKEILFWFSLFRAFVIIASDKKAAWAGTNSDISSWEMRRAPETGCC